MRLQKKPNLSRGGDGKPRISQTGDGRVAWKKVPRFFIEISGFKINLGLIHHFKRLKGGTMRRGLMALIMVVLVMVLGLLPATGYAYTASFPSASSAVVGSIGFISGTEIGYFWSVGRGDSVSQTFSGTGLSSVNDLSLNFNVTRNVLNSGAFVSWDVFVNNNDVGNWVWTGIDGTGPLALHYTFADIVGSGIYAIAMKVMNEVAPGSGSITLGVPGDLTLQGSAVPIPGAIWLFGSGIIGLVGLRKKFRKN